MAMEITVMQGGDVFAQIFNAVATFVRNETWHSLMQIAEIIGVFAVAIVYIKGRDLKSIGLWLLSFVLINTLLLTPKERLIITDLSQPNLVRKVDNVPLGVAFPIYLATLTGNAVARTYDAFLAQPDDLQYTQTGLLFGQRLLEHSFDIVPPSSELASNISNYVKTCLIERNMISKEFKWSSLRRSDNLVGYLSIGKPADFMTYTDETGKTVTQLDCKTAGVMIKNKIQQENSNQRTGTANAFAQKLGIDGILNKSAIAKVNSKLANVQNYFMGTSKSASDIFTQNMLVNQFRKAINSYPVHLDASATLINQTAEQSLTKMKLSHLSSYQVSGRLLPALHTVLLALMVGLFPIMVLAMFIRELAWGVVKNYLAVLMSLMMWPVMFAIFNSIMNTLQYQTLHGQGFTLQNADSIKENATTMAGVAMWLTASIPFLSFRLVTNLGQNLASAGSYLGNAMLSTTNADASQTAAGNYSWGNMQMNNYNGNKVDLNHLYRAGQSTVQNTMGGLETMNVDGSVSYDAGSSMSKLPFSVNWSQNTQNSWNERTTMAINQEARNSQGVRESITNAISHLTGYNSGHTDSVTNTNDSVDTDGVNKINNVGKDNVVNNSDRSTNDKSFGTNSRDGNNVDAKAGLNLVGFGAGINYNSSTGSSASDNYVSSIGKQLENRFNKGESFAKLDGYIESIKESFTDTDFLTTLNNVQKDLRQAQERYNDYVESESKSLNQAKESVLNETNSRNVSHNLDSVLYRHIKDNYSAEEQEKILNSAPTAEGMRLRQKAIDEVTGSYIDDIVQSHQHNTEKLSGSYRDTVIRNTAGASPDDISVNPNQSVVPPSGLGVGTAGGSHKKARLNQELENAQKVVDGKINEATDQNVKERNAIQKQGENVGKLAKESKEMVKKSSEYQAQAAEFRAKYPGIP